MLGLALPEKTLFSILYNILAIIKLVGLIWLMRYLMIKLKKSYDGVAKRDLVRFGTLIALFSSIIMALITFVSYKYLFPDQIKGMMDTIYQSMGSYLDNNSRMALQVMEQSLASISTISNFIYCFLYGWILSLILAPRIAPTDIFND